VVQVDLPDGRPVKVTVDAPAAAATPGKVTVTVRDEPATRKRRRRLAVSVIVSFTVLLGIATLFLSSRARETFEHVKAVIPDKSEEDRQRQLAEAAQRAAEQARLAERQQREAEEARRLALAQKLARVRRPRVQLAYEVETNAAMSRKELPFVVGVLADLSGQPNPPLPPLAKRRFTTIDRDNFDDVLRRAAPRLTLQAPDRLTGGGALPVELSFRRFADFEPAAVAAQVPALKALLQKRHGLSAPEEVAAIDRKLSAQLAAVLHHPEFQRLEATWRGLHYLVHQTETGSLLQVRVLNVTKGELLADLAGTDEPERSAAFGKVHDELTVLGGHPYGLLVGDYEFGRDGQDVRLLQRLAHVAAQSQASLVAGAGPELLGLERFADLGAAGGLAGRFDGPEYDAWRSFRESAEARHVALTLPRALARPPYGARGLPVAEFAFEEVEGEPGSDRLLWMNAAWVFAARVTDAFARDSWPARIHGEDAGKAAGLPAYPLLSGAGVAKRSTEVALPPSRQPELAGLGLLPLIQGAGQDAPLFLGAQSCQRPPAGDVSLARLDVLLCASRCAQYLEVMSRDRIGAFAEPGDMERWLNSWLAQYVNPAPETAGSEQRPRQPLRAARAEVRPVPGRPGAYEIVASLWPEYQLQPPPASPVRLTVLLTRRE
jgi:type VI secretion system protein ImpC